MTQLRNAGWFESGHTVNKKHGFTPRGCIPKIYRVWGSMHARCSNPKHQAYANYGGRGITVCARWAKFENFLADMGDAPAGKSLDRRENDRGYSKDNCRWATPQEQRQNTRANVRITYRGETLCTSEWAHRVGISRHLLWARLHAGWEVSRALTTPAHFYRHKELS
jgi:hypothetical protein